MKDFFFQIMLDMDLLRAEWERKETAKRRDEGIAAAIRRGVKFGRPINKETREKFKKLYPLTRNKDDFEHYRSVKSVIDELGCSKTQFYILKEEIYEEQKNKEEK